MTTALKSIRAYHVGEFRKTCKTEQQKIEDSKEYTIIREKVEYYLELLNNQYKEACHEIKDEILEKHNVYPEELDYHEQQDIEEEIKEATNIYSAFTYNLLSYSLEYGIEQTKENTAVVKYIARFIYRYNLDFTIQQFIEVFYLFLHFPFKVSKGKRKAIHTFGLSAYFDEGSVYTSFFESLVLRNFEENNLGFDSIESYLAFIAQQFNRSKKIHVTVGQYEDIVNTFEVKKDIDVIYILKIMFGKTYENDKEDERETYIGFGRLSDLQYDKSLEKALSYLAREGCYSDRYLI